MTIFVAFGHRKRVGKDTAGRFLCSYLRIALKNSNIQVGSFATRLKDVAFQMYEWAGLQPPEYYDLEENESLKEVVLKDIGKTPRQIWIELGTSVGRHIYGDTWTKLYFNTVKADVSIIRDCRFPNEADQILEQGGFVYRLDRPSIPHTSDIADDPLANYTKWSGIIMNDGTLGDLNKQMVIIGDTIINQLKARKEAAVCQ